MRKCQRGVCVEEGWFKDGVSRGVKEMCQRERCVKEGYVSRGCQREGCVKRVLKRDMCQEGVNERELSRGVLGVNFNKIRTS